MMLRGNVIIIEFQTWFDFVSGRTFWFMMDGAGL